MESPFGAVTDVTSSLLPGDRLEVPCESESLSEGHWRLPSAFGLLWPDQTAVVLEDSSGRRVECRYDARGGWLSGGGLRDVLVQGPGRGVYLSYQGAEPWRFKVVVEATDCRAEEPCAEGAAPPSVVTEQGVPIEFDPSDVEVVAAAGGQEGRGRVEEFQLSLRAARLGMVSGFERLVCLPNLREIELLEHQLAAAGTVLRRFRGRALLCDEVGLGKTIEACIVLSELKLRGLVRSVLVLVPPSLVEQWQGELRRKFGLDFVAYDAPGFRERGAGAWQEFDQVLASFYTAKREPHRSAILSREWDLVIVDEAHHLRNRGTLLWRFASQLRKKFMLLLTATPVQNRLEDLFNLVTLLEPGLLSTVRSFQREFVDRRDKLLPRRVERLHGLLAEVMVRNRRSTVGLRFTQRFAHTQHVVPSEGERAVYAAVASFVKEHLRASQGKVALSSMALLTLQKELGSSSVAAAATLEKLAGHAKLSEAERRRVGELAEAARAQGESSKAERLVALLEERREKTVVFTQFRATQQLLETRLAGAGHEVAVFHGGLGRLEKEAAVSEFRGPADVLLCTESGSEGRNLQFASVVCNFDLPWNPMKIEQRIGRLSRIGQEKDVHVYNLVARDTIEEAILYLLEAKINMFELVVGEIDMILGNLDEEREFEELVTEAWAESSDQTDFRRRMDDLGDRLLAAKQQYLQQRAYEDKLFGERFAPARLEA